MFDVLKRYLLIVWNFFFGQNSSESIQDSPKDQPGDSVDIVPPAEVDDEIVNEVEDDVDDDIEEILDVEGEDDDEEEEEEEDDDEGEEVDTIQDKKVETPKKPEDKIVVNDVPSKPTNLAGKIEDVKVPNVPEKKDAVEIKKPELPKVSDVEIKEKEKPQAKSDETEKKENAEEKKKETPKLKPEFEVIEKESPKVVPSKLKSDFEVIEREGDVQVPDTSELKPEFEIVEREVPKPAPVKVTPELKPDAETKGKEAAPKAVPEKQDATAAKPEAAGTGGIKEPAKAGVPEKDSPKPPSNAADTKTPEKSGKNNHVKFDVDEVKPGAKDPAGTGDVRLSPKSSPLADRKETRPKDDFVALEKGAATTTNQTDVAGGPQKTDNPIDAFISGEQRHTVSQLHPESIQDQQLDYSDSGEELSDDDIEIDYEDDEDDEEVEEVKPLPPVARSVYKKND